MEKPPMENGKDTQLNQIRSREELLRHVQTTDSIFLPREVFEALYLTPQRNVPGDLRKKVY
jgi:hypothetical protein